MAAALIYEVRQSASPDGLEGCIPHAVAESGAQRRGPRAVRRVHDRRGGLQGAGFRIWSL